jgi:signal peptidase I
VSSPDRPVSNIASLTPIVPSTSVEEPPSPTQSRLRSTIEWLAVVVTALAAALLIKEYVFQAFEIPSASMERTVNVGDRILVNKLSYSFGDVQRGDLVVFERLEGTPGSTDDLIKRAIALPGETIEVRSDGRIWIWAPGETADDAARLEEPYLDVQNAVLSTPRASDALTQDIWDTRCVNQPREPGRCTLDDSSYFMMGDNRNASADSRFFGPVPDENVVGRAFARIWPLGDVSTL